MTKQVTKFSKPVCKDLRDTFFAEVEELAKKYGMEADTKNMRFYDTSCDVKLVLTIAGAESVEVKDFKLYANMFGMEPTDLGRKYRSNGKVFTISGYLRSRRKLNILIVDQDGKAFINSVEDAKRGLSYAEVK